MIRSFCDSLRRDMTEVTENLRSDLERGTPSRDQDERLRGELRGLRRALQMLEDLEERARRAAAAGDDML